MPIFIYKALDQAGQQQQGELEAANKEIAIQYLKADNLLPIYLEEKGKIKNNFLKTPSVFFKKITLLDKMFLARHLAAILKAGINLKEALEILIEDIERPFLKKILIEAEKNIEKGQPLFLTFELYKNYFSPVFVGLIKAGEASGTLEDNLKNLADQLQKDYELRKKITSAMIYPAILLTGSLLVIIILLTFIMPRLTSALVQAKIELPAITKMFISISDWLSTYPYLTIGIFFLTAIIFVLIFKRPKTKEFVIGLLFKLPISKDLIKKITLARLTKTLANLLKSGLPILEAIEITSQVSGNKKYETALIDIRNKMKKGLALYEAFKSRADLFPHLVVSIIAVGEKTGSLENSLITIANYYEQEADRLLKNLVSLLEPILLIIMGIVIASIALSILLPIYQLVSTFR